MGHPLRRRQFTKLALGAAIVGFEAEACSWVTEARADGRPFDRVPRLDGALLLDEASRKAIAVDRGNMFHRMPAAVLRPGSVQDIVAMVRFASQHELKVAIRGDGHSRYGQTMVEGGLVIDSRSLNAVHVRTPDSADAQLGAFWSEVADATLARGVTPRVFPATCLALTVGGTLSVGGIGNTSHRYGAQVDNVAELDVVTGDGRLVTCSPARESELFEMVLAGQGQCGVIVRARLPLVPAPTHAVLYELTYTDLDAYLADQSRLVSEGRFDSQRGTMIRDKGGAWSFVMELGKFFTPPEEPDRAALQFGLRFSSAAAPARMTYREYLFRFEARNAAAPAGRPSPVITMWIPASATRDYLGNILSLSPEAAGLVRFGGVESFSCYPVSTRRFTRPLLRMPSEEQAFTLWLFRSANPGDDAALSALLVSNRELLAKMVAVGGKRYAPYSMVISAADWQAHFGPDVWRRLVAAKARYDPHRVLSPEPAMFAVDPPGSSG